MNIDWVINEMLRAKYLSKWIDGGGVALARNVFGDRHGGSFCVQQSVRLWANSWQACHNDGYLCLLLHLLSDPEGLNRSLLEYLIRASQINAFINLKEKSFWIPWISSWTILLVAWFSSSSFNSLMRLATSRLNIRSIFSRSWVSWVASRVASSISSASRSAESKSFLTLMDRRFFAHAEVLLLQFTFNRPTFNNFNRLVSAIYLAPRLTVNWKFLIDSNNTSNNSLIINIYWKIKKNRSNTCNDHRSQNND